MTHDSTMAATVDSEFGHSDATGNQVFGFWLYLMSDLVLFGALFSTYVVLAHGHADGASGKELFHLPYVFAETMFLLFSSATCGLAMLAVHEGRKGRVSLWLVITLLLGLGFIVMELREFTQLILEGHRPERNAFLSSFFTLVGTHGAHVTAGLVWITTMLFQLAAKGLTPSVQSRLIRLSLFWHFLDIVWVGVFTVVYLTGVM